MKYIRGSFDCKIDDLKHSKIRLSMEDGFGETPWIGTSPNEKENCVLLNDALIFMPFESWGMILPRTDSMAMDDLRKGEVITLHPEIFDQYVKGGIINKEGTPLIDYKQKLKVYRTHDED